MLDNLCFPRARLNDDDGADDNDEDDDNEGDDDYLGIPPKIVLNVLVPRLASLLKAAKLSCV